MVTLMGDSQNRQTFDIELETKYICVNYINLFIAINYIIGEGWL